MGGTDINNLLYFSQIRKSLAGAETLFTSPPAPSIYMRWEFRGCEALFSCRTPIRFQKLMRMKSDLTPVSLRSTPPLHCNGEGVGG